MKDLLEKSAKFLLESLDAVSILDETGKYLYANEKWLECCKKTTADIYNHYAWHVVPDTGVRHVLRTHTPVIAHPVTINGDKHFTSYYPIMDNNKLCGVLIIVLLTGMESAINFSRMVDSMQRELSSYKSRMDAMVNASYSINNIIGESAAIKQVREQITSAARTKSTVLIEGETGTGKELVAHSIHALSPRSAARLVRINCSAIPEELMESELFGYETGAFTGAKKTGKKGKFELADGGSIFFDEINQLPLTMQPKLLRVLQEREVERVGGSVPLPVDVRVISATNVPLEKLVQEKMLRQDLYYRLNIFKIKIPPLRERREDIPLLTKSLIFKLNYQLDMNISKIEDDALELFCKYDWPGNIRELQNVLECAMNNATEDTLELRHFKSFTELTSSMGRSFSAGAAKPPRQSVLQGLDDEKAKALILRTLEKTGGNKRAAAHELQISRTILYKKLSRYQII